MARYERGYTGEKRTVKRTVKLTPCEDAEFQAAAKAAGAPTLSQFHRELLFRRLSAVVAAGMRRNPDAAALIREIRAIGVNYNQLKKYQNSTGEREREPGEEDEIESLIKQAMRRVIDL